MSTLALDANGLPLGHDDAAHAAANDLRALVNELPESVYHLGPLDAEWIADVMLQRYVSVLKTAQRPCLEVVK